MANVEPYRLEIMLGFQVQFLRVIKGILTFGVGPFVSCPEIQGPGPPAG